MVLPWIKYFEPKRRLNTKIGIKRTTARSTGNNGLRGEVRHETVERMDGRQSHFAGSCDSLAPEVNT
jgi:hypothetical protein